MVVDVHPGSNEKRCKKALWIHAGSQEREQVRRVKTEDEKWDKLFSKFEKEGFPEESHRQYWAKRKQQKLADEHGVFQYWLPDRRGEQ